jgi:hypothetical protein
MKTQLILAILVIVKSIRWEVDQLLNSFKSSPNKQLFDPDGYIDDEPLNQQTITKINTLSDVKHFKTYVFIIDGIADNYMPNNFESFEDSVSKGILDGNKAAEMDSLIILFSINDRKSRIRVGSNVRTYLSD